MAVLDVAEQPLTLVRGEDAVIPGVAAAATDITAWALAFRVSTSGGKDVLLTVATADGIAGQASDGSFTLAVSAARTKALAAGPYRWDLWREGAGHATPLAGGPLTVKEPVRRPS